MSNNCFSNRHPKVEWNLQNVSTKTIASFVNVWGFLLLLLWTLLMLLLKSKLILLVSPHQINTIHPNSLFITILAIGCISKCIPYRRIFNLQYIQETKFLDLNDFFFLISVLGSGSYTSVLYKKFYSWKISQNLKWKLLNRLYPSKKAETKGNSTCRVLMFVRSLKLTVFNHREIKIEEKSSTEPRKDISRTSHISDSVSPCVGAWRKCFPF